MDTPRRSRGPVIVAGAVALAGIGALIAVPNLQVARRHSNEAHAVGALAEIRSAQQIFRDGGKGRAAKLHYATLAELAREGLVDPELGSGTKRGYVFQAAPSVTTSEFLWFAVANPEVPGDTGDRCLETNTSGVIFHTSAGPFRMNTTDCAPASIAVSVSR